MDGVKNTLPFAFLASTLCYGTQRQSESQQGQQPRVPWEAMRQEMSQAGSQNTVWGVLFIQKQFLKACQGGHWRDQREDTLIPSPGSVLETVNHPSIGKDSVWAVGWR